MKYLILVSADNTRDTQVYAGPPNDPDKTFSDCWTDCKDAEVFVGLYSADTEADALEAGAAYFGLPATSLRAFCLDPTAGGNAE